MGKVIKIHHLFACPIEIHMFADIDGDYSNRDMPVGSKPKPLNSRRLPKTSQLRSLFSSGNAVGQEGHRSTVD